MRKTFIATLVELAREDERIVLLTGDLGFMVIDPFVNEFPERFINVGVAEQNMIGIATGLAEAGFIPFCYSIATFASLRPFEFIRNGPILHQLPVRIIGVGGGFEYGAAGFTHHAIEDIGVMRTQFGLNIVAPADYQQTRTALLKTWDLPQPTYYRLGKNEIDVVPGLDGEFETGKIQVIRNGSDTLILTMGGISHHTYSVVEQLVADGLDIGIGIIASISPPPIDDLASILAHYGYVHTIEEHVMTGGIGSMVSEVIADHNLNIRLTRHGIRKLFDGRSGSQQGMYKKHALDRESLVAKIHEVSAV